MSSGASGAENRLSRSGFRCTVRPVRGVGGLCDIVGFGRIGGLGVGAVMQVKRSRGARSIFNKKLGIAGGRVKTKRSSSLIHREITVTRKQNALKHSKDHAFMISLNDLFLKSQLTCF